ncbi:tumor necrosis factor receptor superfamily member 5 isoform X1 [Epinephelus fuscoguttatus]|uniref:tumor necrosis factor receptor superfamily member 5 isoform X1 n=1 Tax=Epinephelus fuscoguttatus TaxID=293821 RepID=UPI0020D06CA8|nr:tumor necrosis factor receptor superfamily member 5 isoform X1 [Epinephelus fuscoguttatus]
MHLLLLLSMIMGALVAAAQPRCDPLTQYEKDGECCKMCGPGTRMVSLSSGSCLDPGCIDCGEDEYQDKYTAKLLCERQPYCDPLRNFEVRVSKNKKEKIPCMCKYGFHCSSEQCLTCVPHTTCAPGHGARIIGNHAHDTECQECKDDTFSNNTSWDGVCEKWTQCADGYQIQKIGTGVSDNICERTPRKHILVICLVSLVILILLALGFTYWRCQGDASQKVKICVESCMGEHKKGLPNETIVPMMQPDEPIEEESTFPQSLPEEGGAGPPEENEHEPHQEMSAVGRTELGNVVAEEIGKSAIVSRQESQTETFTD